MTKPFIPILLLFLLLPSYTLAASQAESLGIDCSFLVSRTPLPLGVTARKVQYLQKLLNLDATTQVSTQGAGSPGKETMKYGVGTKNALKRFQAKYKDDILIPNGLTTPTGILGMSTKAKLYALYCIEVGTTPSKPSPEPTPLPLPNPDPTPVPTPVPTPDPTPSPTPLPPQAPPTPAPVPPASSPLSGSCGSSNNQSFTTVPTTNLCTTGTASSVIINSSTYSWSCLGSNGGTTASCSATRTITSSPSGSLSIASTTCIIATGASVCTIPVSWSITNPVSPSVRQGSTQFSTSATGSSIPRSLSYGTNTFTLLDGATTLDTKTASASCVAGTSWNESATGNGKCVSNKPQIPVGTTLGGEGISSAYAPGCKPELYNDFIDNAYWSIRRVEPRDCAIVKEVTPVFAWPRASGGNKVPVKNPDYPWTFTLYNSIGKVVYSGTTPVQRLYLPDRPLSPGSYTWEVSYKDKKTGNTITSQARRFVIPIDNTGFTFSNASNVLDLTLAKSHPRALPKGATFKEIATLSQSGEYKNAYEYFLKQADIFQKQVPPVPPTDKIPTDFPTMNAYWDWNSSLTSISSKEESAILTLGYAYHFTGDAKYASAGVARLMNLALWPTSGATSDKTNDAANRSIYSALAMGIDLFADVLTPEQTATIVKPLKDRLGQALARLPGLDTSANYDSHVVNIVKTILSTLLYSAGTPGFPESTEWLKLVWDTWITTQGTWGADGQWANSTAYGWYSLISLVQITADIKLITGIDMSPWTAISGFGDNQIAFTPPVTLLNAPFGDDTNTADLYRFTKTHYRLYASLTRNPVDEWYWRVDPSNIDQNKTLLSPLHFLYLGYKLPQVTPKAPTTNSYILEDVGLAAIHSTTADPNRSSLYFRSSRLGSYNHSHADNNGFTFVSKGKALFISGGYYPYYNSPHHALVGRATRFKNTLTYDGGMGQAEPSSTTTVPGSPVISADPHGKLINFLDSGIWGVVTGDATLAYRSLDVASSTYNAWRQQLTSAIRTAAYNRQEKVAVIYDYATSDKARTWELNFNMLSSPTLTGSTLQFINSPASACVDVYNLPGSFVITHGFPIPPEDEHASLPDQYQAHWTASTPSKELAAVTVIREDCRPVPVNVTWSGSQASVSINGSSPIVMDKKTVIVP